MEAALSLVWENSYGSTSVDDICQKAGVKKGSFYHFFDSKSALAVAALEAGWQKMRPTFDALFSPAVPPLERISGYLNHVVQKQSETHCACGSVLGCPLFSLGSEVCTLDPAIRTKVRELLDRYVKYFESAIRDAQAAGEIRGSDAKTKARLLYALLQGTLTQARIQNNLDALREVVPAALDLLGAVEPAPAGA